MDVGYCGIMLNIVKACQKVFQWAHGAQNKVAHKKREKEDKHDRRE